jgi:RimJ/RimL family protein N-acetyltransferase
MTSLRPYPKRVESPGGAFDIRPMVASDEAAVLAFAQSLPTHDLLFLPRDISQAKVLSAWIKEIDRGTLTSLLAVRGAEVLGCGTLVQDPLSWSPHVGEIRVVVSRGLRKQGVGRALSQEIFALALAKGLQRITAQMTVDQSAAIAIFEGLGFRGEALLRDHVRDRDGALHDIVILGHDVARVRAQMEAFGLPEAV